MLHFWSSQKSIDGSISSKLKSDAIFFNTIKKNSLVFKNSVRILPAHLVKALKLFF